MRSVSLFQVHIFLGAEESALSSPPGLRLDDLTWHEVSISRSELNISLEIDRIHKER